MKKTSEFRIGNVILTADGWETVTEIFTDCISTDKGSLPMESVKVLILTPAHLIGFGFSEVRPRAGVYRSFIREGIRINLSKSGNFYYHRWNTIDFVHELQNIWFSIFKEELTPAKDGDEKRGV